MPRFTNIHISEHPEVARTGAPGHSLGGYDNGQAFSANFPLMLISEARNRGINFDNLSDGYCCGPYADGDWSRIRDSTPEAVAAMLERALNFLFDELGAMRCEFCSCIAIHTKEGGQA